MSNTFAELYTPFLKSEVFLTQARERLELGADGLTCAREYAEQGKPEFALAYLLLTELAEDEKREIFALAFERRAQFSEEKAEQFDQQFHRPFPLIKLEAQKDRLSASQVRQGKRVRREAKVLKLQ